MQRQSLGSPSSKLAKDEHLHSQLSSSSSSASYGQICSAKEEEEAELIKKLNPKSTPPQTFIHLIPILTLLCFLILYLSSHDPSLAGSDFADSNGVEPLSKINESRKNHISELNRILEIGKGDLLAVRSLKNLKQESIAAEHRRRHRKMGQF